MEAGSYHVKNPSMIYISGTQVRETLVVGSGFDVYFVEEK